MSELRQRMIECLQLNTLPPSPFVVSDSSTTNAAKKLVHLRVVARAAPEEAVPHQGRSTPDSRAPQTAALPGLSHHHLLLRPALTGRNKPAGERHRQHPQDDPPPHGKSLVIGNTILNRLINLSSCYLLPNLTVTRLEQSPVSTTQT